MHVLGSFTHLPRVLNDATCFIFGIGMMAGMKSLVPGEILSLAGSPCRGGLFSLYAEGPWMVDAR